MVVCVFRITLGLAMIMVAIYGFNRVDVVIVFLSWIIFPPPPTIRTHTGQLVTQ